MGLHRSSNYKDLSYLVGQELNYLGGFNFTFPVDGRVRVLEEYKNTILVEFEWIYSHWYGVNKEPRTLRVLVPKASLVTGAVKLQVKATGELLTLNSISDLVDELDCIIK